MEDRAAQGDVDALFEFATLCLAGERIPRDLARARMLLRRAAALGHGDAALLEIALTANGSWGSADWADALRLLKTAAAHDALAKEQLSQIEAMGLDDAGDPVCPLVPEPLSESPRVLRFARLFDPAECRRVALAAQALLAPTVVIDPATGRTIAHPIRTSHGAVIGPAREDLVLAALNRRIAAISGTNLVQGEPLSVLHYAPGQQYRPHYDALPGTANQRIKTVLIYLNEGFGGGETRFIANGLTIRPRAGDAILFDNVTAGGEIDPRSRHAGLPVTSGAKWLATRWIREKPYNPWTDYGT